jgi:hypothetical protein
MLRLFMSHSSRKRFQIKLQMLSSPEIKAEVKIIFQTVEDLHTACPKI